VKEILSATALGTTIGILIEKPAAPTVEELASMVAEAERSGAILTIGHHLNYTRAAWLHRLAHSGYFGVVYRITVEWLRRQGTPRRDAYLQRHLSGGGVGMDLLTHLLDLAYGFVGDAQPFSITAHTQNHMLSRIGRIDGIGIPDVEDTISGILSLTRPDFRGPCIIQFAAGWDSHISADRLDVQIHGTRGGARLWLMSENGEQWLEAEVYTDLEGQPVNITPARRGLNVADCYAAQIADLEAAVRARRAVAGTDRVPVITQRAALVLRAVLGAYESSSNDGELISLLDS
jgi:predicted dehydrogenase